MHTFTKSGQMYIMCTMGTCKNQFHLKAHKSRTFIDFAIGCSCMSLEIIAKYTRFFALILVVLK
jgi:hypothetical protein